MAKLSEKKGENLSAEELETILISDDYKTQGTLSSEENILDRTLTSKDGKYTIPVSEIYSGSLTTRSNETTIIFRLNRGWGDENPSYESKEGMTWREWIAEYSREDFSENAGAVQVRNWSHRFFGDTSWNINPSTSYDG